MPDHSEFIAAILEEPDDDTLRLVYADWLEEQGDPRAELIRIQCTLAEQWASRLNLPRAALAVGMPNEVDVQLLDRERALTEELTETWLKPLSGVEGDTIRAGEASTTGFVRGVVGTWVMKVGAFLKKANQKKLLDFASTFGIDSLLVQEKTKRVAAVAESPVLEWIRELNWARCDLDDEGFTTLVHSARLHRLSSLRLSRTQCSDKALGVLSKGADLPRLRHLGLDAGPRNTFTDKGVLAILRNAKRPLLDSLSVNSSGFRVAQFAAGPENALSGLKRLEIVSSRDVESIVDCEHLGNLERLGLHGSDLSLQSLRTLIDAPRFEQLRALTCRVAEDVGNDLIDELHERFDSVRIMNRFD